MSIKIYTDGACKGNPGDGGWGALIIYPDNEEEIFGYEENTTNNRMELLAAIKALEAIREKKEVTIYTDSMYLQQGITSWINNWKLNNLIEIKSRMNGWQLTSFKKSYSYKCKHGISLEKKRKMEFND